MWTAQVQQERGRTEQGRVPERERGQGREQVRWWDRCHSAMNTDQSHESTTKRNITAVLNEPLLGVGLNDDALTFNRLALVGERGVADALVEEERDAAAPAALACEPAAGGVPLARFPLNGGIGWMTIEMRLEAASLLALPEDVLIRAGALAPDGCGEAAFGIFAVDGAAAPCPFEEFALALVVSVEGPMTRAWPDSASFVAFSRICRCFSSSFARMVTRSSGIGLFS